jgi:hypothetical protein
MDRRSAVGLVLEHRKDDMRPIQAYLTYQASSLRNEFNQLRQMQKDSDVRGAGNESIMARFCERHFASKVVCTNTTIIDSFDRQSDELDVVVCNADQPFLTGDSSPQILVAEGVDFVIQVKATLTSTEVKRIISNARSVKQLIRTGNVGDQIYGRLDADIPLFVNRIPYVCVAFASRLKLTSAAQHFERACQEVPLEEQPDAIFVLDRGMIVNARAGGTTIGHDYRGFDAADLGEQTLLGLMYVLYKVVPRFLRWNSPLINYMGSRPQEITSQTS